jgi:hypothetical protein
MEITRDQGSRVQPMKVTVQYDLTESHSKVIIGNQASIETYLTDTNTQ